ncbi:MAG: shikimate dehydrogenase [Ignavibacterium album]|uniref:shikimate dehydrogenase n=1 Tax=Ignavibacterium album TaxID=591197 RepID=UPI0026F2C88F|nr:shikimate dehydrogenase [Ignavibacterium album]MCX8104864.1 shikimate dehydrogenase [Ignavibacterium album]
MKDSMHLKTQLVGLIGHPIKHTYSPFIHNVAFELTGLDYIYLPFNVVPVNLKSAIKGLVALGYKGFNVTIPHKVKVKEFMSKVSEEASLVGAINTVLIEDGKLFGYNTDVAGALETLYAYRKEITGNECVVIGAGGSARAVIYTLIKHFRPSRIHLVNRTEQRAETLRQFFKTKMKFDSFTVNELIPPDIKELVKGSALVINATSVGMHPDEDDAVLTQKDIFTKDQIVFDLVYNPTQTKLLKLAQSSGARTVDGIKMLVNQAAKSFEIWTGEKMPVEQVEKALLLKLNK